MKKEEETKKIEQVKNIFGSWYDFTNNLTSSVVMLDDENAFVCTNDEVFFCNIPTADEFKLGEIKTGKELGYDDDCSYDSDCGYDVDPENLGYYFVPTWDENGEPDQYPSASVADEIDFLNGVYSDADVGKDDAWKAFQKEVAELKKEQQQKQEE